MSMNVSPISPCPAAGRDDRKSAEFAAKNLLTFDGAKIVRSFTDARDLLRSPAVRQAGSNSSEIVFDNPAHISFFFLDGEQHRRRRASVAAYFTPKVIITRYHPIIDRTMAKLTAELRAKGAGVLDEMALELASNVTVESLESTTVAIHLVWPAYCMPFAALRRRRTAELSSALFRIASLVGIIRLQDRD
jgi:cytochrome P450